MLRLRAAAPARQTPLGENVIAPPNCRKNAVPPCDGSVEVSQWGDTIMYCCRPPQAAVTLAGGGVGDYVSDACQTLRKDLGLQKVLQQVGGCSPFGRTAAQIAIAAAAVGTVGPAALPLVSTLGAGAVVDCLCTNPAANFQLPPLPPPPPPAPSIFANPLLWVGVGGLLLGLLALGMSGRKRGGTEVVYAE